MLGEESIWGRSERVGGECDQNRLHFTLAVCAHVHEMVQE